MIKMLMKRLRADAAGAEEGYQDLLRASTANPFLRWTACAMCREC